jgi:hypothetical protein
VTLFGSSREKSWLKSFASDGGGAIGGGGGGGE